MDHIVKVTALSTPPQHLQIKNQRLVLKRHTQSHQTLLDQEFAYLIFLRIQQQPRLLPTSTNLTPQSKPDCSNAYHGTGVPSCGYQKQSESALCQRVFDVAIHDSTHHSFQLPHLS